MGKQKNIDSHAHIIPDAFERMVMDGTLKNIKILEMPSDKKIIQFEDGSKHPYTDDFISIENRMELMKMRGIDKQAISITPRFFFYHLPVATAQTVNRSFNDNLAQIEKKYPEQFIGVGSVPLQDVKASVQELERIKVDLGFRSIQIGTSVNGMSLSDQKFVEFFKAAEALNVLIFLHPLIKNDNPQTKNYHLSNLVGNPTQTTEAVANIIFSGLFDKAPNLKIALVHGGGFLPYQLGRMEHGYGVRSEAKLEVKKGPEYYAKKNLYFDGLTHSQSALKFLVEEFGANKVMLGTDCPYDMAEYDQLERIDKLEVTQEEKTKILFKNASGLLEKEG